MTKRDYDEAAREFERTLALDTDGVRGLLKAGDERLRNGDVEGAIASYEAYADAVLESGFLLKARAVLERVLALRPDKVEPRRKLLEIDQKLFPVRMGGETPD